MPATDNPLYPAFKFSPASPLLMLFLPHLPVGRFPVFPGASVTPIRLSHVLLPVEKFNFNVRSHRAGAMLKEGPRPIKRPQGLWRRNPSRRLFWPSFAHIPSYLPPSVNIATSGTALSPES
jgi:hypothetical protein